ncbi:MAG: hypothetical protein E2P00_04165 [Acidobacteria bacterium]|nr:MAG: hypothetical protein E2P00_04165 [Acidobacteriota bacterium]
MNMGRQLWKPRAARAITILLLVFAWSWSHGGGTRTYDLADFRDLEGLQLQGISISERGGLIPGPVHEPRVGPALPIIWKALADEEGTVFAVGGDPGTLLRLPVRGEGEILLQVEEAELTALALLPGGELVVASSPGGRVLHLSPDGSRLHVMETGSRYVWDLLAADDGSLWIAAGDPGAVFRWRPGSEAVRMADLGSQQARCLTPVPGDAVLVGTAGEGRVLRIEKAGSVKVLLVTDFPEVVDITTDQDGSIYMALSRSMSRNGGDPVTGQPGNGAPAKPPVRVGADDFTGGERVIGMVARLDAEGQFTELWHSSDETPMALLVRPQGEILVGCTPGGVVRAIRAPSVARLVARLRAASVTHLALAPAGGVIVATGGLGTVGVLEDGPGRTGVAVSPVHDAGMGVRYGAARWWLRRGRAADVQIAFRSGPTARPDGNWNPWSPWRRDGVAAPAAPPDRYLQWRMRLESTRRGPAPEVARVQVSYLPMNHPPVVSLVEVLPPGVVMDLLPVPPGQAAAPAGSPAARELAGGMAAFSQPTVRVRRSWQAGKRTVRWEARDADDDPLRARLFLRADGETEFLLLAEDLHDSFYVFSEGRLADGGYVIEVEVSDSPGNTARRARATRHETSRFEVDRTPPRIESLAWKQTPSGWHFRFTVEDGRGPPQVVRMAVDDGLLLTVLPLDGVEDTPREEYEVDLPAAAAGLHVVVVEARDSAGNSAVRRLRFTSQE